MLESKELDITLDATTTSYTLPGWIYSYEKGRKARLITLTVSASGTFDSATVSVQRDADGNDREFSTAVDITAAGYTEVLDATADKGSAPVGDIQFSIAGGMGSEDVDLHLEYDYA